MAAAARSPRRVLLGALLALAGLPAGLSSAGEASWDPRAPGPFEVAPPVTVGGCALGAGASASAAEVKVVVHAPRVPGEFPVIAFVPGFTASAASYGSLLGHLASHGLAVLGLDIPRLRTAAEGAAARAEDVTAALQCIAANDGATFAEHFSSAGGHPGVKFDVADRLGLLAHSVGGHAVLHLLDRISCLRVRFVALLDPVDGLDPYGFEPQYLLPLGIHPSYILNFSAPVALLTSGLAGRPVHYPHPLHWPACAPDDRSGLHWFASLRAPKWLINFTEYGHLDLLDEDAHRHAMDLVCPSGPGAATPASRDAYRRGLGGLVVALAEALLPEVPEAPPLPQASRLQWLEDATAALAPLNTTSVNERGTLPLQAHCRRSGSGHIGQAASPSLLV